VRKRLCLFVTINYQKLTIKIKLIVTGPSNNEAKDIATGLLE